MPETFRYFDGSAEPVPRNARTDSSAPGGCAGLSGEEASSVGDPPLLELRPRLLAGDRGGEEGDGSPSDEEKAPRPFGESKNFI